ncbi:MAG: Hint domain-containing protein, partial [Betaproteobacteria bacterium]|nr:Hint domain-containing protein [Betaproteobacteria bacterium]
MTKTNACNQLHAQGLAALTPVYADYKACFVAGTLVRTKDGMKPIEEIRVGDWVLSYPDDQTPPKRPKREDEYFYRQVTKTFVTDDQLVSYIKALNP